MLAWAPLLLILAGPVDDAAVWAEAEALRDAGDYDEAARVFAPLAQRYPQDYATQLQAAYLAFLAGDYAAAEAGYALASELSQGAALARAGLAWTHLRMGQHAQARAEFTALLAEHPGLAEAEAGLAELDRLAAIGPSDSSAGRRVAISPMAFGLASVYAGHPSLAWAAGASVHAPMIVADRVLLTVGYAYARFAPVGGGGLFGRAGNPEPGPDEPGPDEPGPDVGPGPGEPGGPEPIDTGTERFDQHLAHLGIGARWDRAGFLAQYAYLHDGSALANHAHALGLSLRYSPWGDLVVDGSATRFTSSGWIGRVAPSWRMPATAWLDLRPGAAIQIVDGEALPSGFASVRVHGRPGSLTLGGKGGIEERPVYLELPAIFAFAGQITWGAWLSGQLAVGRGVYLHASYSTHRLRAPTETGGVASTQIHDLAFGLSWRPQP